MVSTPDEGANVEDVLIEVIHDADIAKHKQLIVFELRIRRLDHFHHIKDNELIKHGFTQPEVKRLRAAIATVQQRARQYNLEPQLVYVRSEAPLRIDLNKSAITKEQIKLMELIGEGTFAVVKRGIWMKPDGQRLDVAVKILREVSETVMEDLQVEASHLLKLQHPHLIRMYGVVQQPAMMVFELCEGGALLDRLRDDTKPVPLVSRLHEYCIQIVKALTYLERMHCVHRDVAARNILLSRDESVVKICDFGLMRNLKENEQMYVMAAQKRVPFSWCPPESLRQRKFSHASDVWAFGVTVWEIFSLGEEPWIGCRAIEVLKRLDAGERLEKPAFCSKRIYDIVSMCWKMAAEDRPTFNLLRNLLKEAEFNNAEVRENHPGCSEKPLAVTVGEKIIVIEDADEIWYGQSERSRKFGNFPRKVVFMQGRGAVAGPTSTPQKEVLPAVPSTVQKPPITAINPSPAVKKLPIGGGSALISMPIQGSFIHAGHGDVRGNSWGDPGKIDEIYLRNPVVGDPMSSSGYPQRVSQMFEPDSQPSTSRSSFRAPSPAKPSLPEKNPIVNGRAYGTMPSTSNGYSTPASGYGSIGRGYRNGAQGYGASGMQGYSNSGYGNSQPGEWHDAFDEAERDCFSPSRIEFPAMPSTHPSHSMDPPSYDQPPPETSRGYGGSQFANAGPSQQQIGRPTAQHSAIIVPTATGAGRIPLPTNAPPLPRQAPATSGNNPISIPSATAPRPQPVFPALAPPPKTDRQKSITPPAMPTNGTALTANNSASLTPATKSVGARLDQFDAAANHNAFIDQISRGIQRKPSNLRGATSAHDDKVLAELNNRINALRPTAGISSNVPSNASPSNSPRVIMTDHGITLAQEPDPFTIPSAVRNVIGGQHKFYNDMFEQRPTTSNPTSALIAARDNLRPTVPATSQNVPAMPSNAMPNTAYLQHNAQMNQQANSRFGAMGIPLAGLAPNRVEQPKPAMQPVAPMQNGYNGVLQPVRLPIPTTSAPSAPTSQPPRPIQNQNPNQMPPMAPMPSSVNAQMFVRPPHQQVQQQQFQHQQPPSLTAVVPPVAAMGAPHQQPLQSAPLIPSPAPINVPKPVAAPVAPVSQPKPTAPPPTIQPQRQPTPPQPSPPQTVQQPTRVALPPVAATAEVRQTHSASPIGHTSSSNVVQERPSPAPGPTALTTVDRRSRIENEVASLLPQPSPLFYGGSGSSGAQSSASMTESVLPKPSPLALGVTGSSNSSSAPAITALPTASAPQNVPAPQNAPRPIAAPAPVPSQPQPQVRPTPAPVAPALSSQVLEPVRLPVNYGMSADAQAAAAVAAAAAEEERRERERQRAEQEKKDRDIAMILNSYNFRPNELAGPSSTVPLFALGNNSPSYAPPAYGSCGMSYGMGMGAAGGYGGSSMPLWSPHHYGQQGFGNGMLAITAGGESTLASIPRLAPMESNFVLEEGADIVAALDPLARPSPPSTTVRASTDSTVSMTEQMEVLYQEASFTNHAACDAMVAKCQGSVSEALQELKVNYLLNDLSLSNDSIRVRSALAGNNWDINAAASALLG